MEELLELLEEKPKSKEEKLSMLIMGALLNGDAHAVHMLIKHGANIHQLGEDDNCTLLHYATNTGSLPCMKVLIDNGLCVDVKTRNGETPLHRASCVSADCVRLLIDHDANVNIRDVYGYTPLHRAVEARKPACIKVLLDNGADPEIKDEETFTPLFLAVHCEEIGCMRALLSKANVNAVDENNYTALHLAASRGFLKGMKLLLKFEADLNCKGRLFIMGMSLVNDHTHCHRKLIGKGRQVCYESIDGDTAFVPGPCNMCIKNFKDRISDSNTGITPLHLAVYERYAACVKLLIAHGAEIDIQEGLGMTPLHVCAKMDYPEIATILINGGAAINIRTVTRMTPLMLAAKYNIVSCLKLLLEAGAEIETMCNCSALGYAAMEGHKECVQLLLSFGAKINAVQKRGGTALLLAAEHAKFEVVKILLKNGAFLWLPD